MISSNNQISNFMKIRRNGAELIHAKEGQREREREREMTKLIIAFGNFTRGPKTDRNFENFLRFSHDL
jgi:hypothetical protein